MANLEDIGNIVVKSVRGVPVLIKDVGEVNFGKELRTGAATKDGHETVLGTVFMLMGENSRIVAQRSKQNLKKSTEPYRKESRQKLYIIERPS